MKVTIHYLSAVVAETLHLKLKFLRNPNHTLCSFFFEREKEVEGEKMKFRLLEALMNKRKFVMVLLYT
jgi:hypothetical protein